MEVSVALMVIRFELEFAVQRSGSGAYGSRLHKVYYCSYPGFLA